MAGTKRFEDFSLSLLQRFAEKTGLPADLMIRAAKEAAERTWDAWTDLRWDLASPGIIAQAVDRHMRNVPIMREVNGVRMSVGVHAPDTADF